MEANETCLSLGTRHLASSSDQTVYPGTLAAAARSRDRGAGRALAGAEEVVSSDVEDRPRPKHTRGTTRLPSVVPSLVEDLGRENFLGASKPTVQSGQSTGRRKDENSNQRGQSTIQFRLQFEPGPRYVLAHDLGQFLGVPRDVSR